MAGINYYQMYTGLRDQKKAQRYLDSLAEPEFLTGQQAYNQGFSGTQGYSQQEKNAYFQQNAKNNNAAYSHATAVNPSSSGAVLAALNYVNSSSLNQFAANDARIHRSEAGRLGDMIRLQKNLMTSYDIMKHQQAGQAVQDSKKRFESAWRAEEGDVKQVFSTIYGRGAGGQQDKITTSDQQPSGYNGYIDTPNDTGGYGGYNTYSNYPYA